MNTRGHLAAYGGLRGHSVGHTYPWTVIRKGDYWHTFNCVNGQLGRPWRSCELAHRIAEGRAQVPDFN
jgi:hypothetical protein